jgi:hypothetical protein
VSISILRLMMAPLGTDRTGPVFSLLTSGSQIITAPPLGSADQLREAVGGERRGEPDGSYRCEFLQ